MSRWVKIDTRILEWRWSHKPEYMSFAIHCIALANPQPKKWQTIEIPRGSFVTTMQNMSERVGISERTYRTIIKHLQECEFLSVKSTNKYTMITICNYDSYQINPTLNRQSNDNQMSNDRQSNDNQMSNDRQSNDNQTTTTIEYKEYIDNNTKENKDVKDFFLKNGEAAEKKVLKIEELKAALAAEGIYMTEAGYKEFKALNEGKDGYGYKGGIIRSAQNFLQKPMNQKYSLKGNNGNGKGKGKNTPPTSPPPPDPATVQLWENVKAELKEALSTVDFKTWILPIKPDKIVGDEITIAVPSQPFAEHIEENLISQFQMALNKQKINKLTYIIKK